MKKLLIAFLSLMIFAPAISATTVADVYICKGVSDSQYLNQITCVDGTDVSPYQDRTKYRIIRGTVRAADNDHKKIICSITVNIDGKEVAYATGSASFAVYVPINGEYDVTFTPLYSKDKELYRPETINTAGYSENGEYVYLQRLDAMAPVSEPPANQTASTRQSGTTTNRAANTNTTAQESFNVKMTPAIPNITIIINSHCEGLTRVSARGNLILLFGGAYDTPLQTQRLQHRAGRLQRQRTRRG